MKVILTTFVRGLGKEGDIVNVSDGYARNALFPKKLAKPATRAVIQAYEQKRRAKEQKRARERENDIAILSTLNGKTLTLVEDVNEKGRLYHRIRKADIVRAVQDQFGVFLDEKFIEGDLEIRELGTISVPLSAHGEKAKLTIEVKAKNA